jgi:spectinomycin phosphotransferase
MRAPPDGIDADSVVAALRDGWELDVRSVEYAPLGGGSYHWVVTDETAFPRFATVDDLGHKAWLGSTCDAAFDGLQRAFDTCVALAAGGLRFVVAPLPTRDGASLGRLDSRYALSLFPFVTGESGTFGRYEGDGHRRAVVAMLAELHGATATAGSAARVVGFDLPGRNHLEAALAQRDEPWTGGPLSERARAAVRAGASDLVELLGLADRLAAEARAQAGDRVLTHGEPHGGNTMRTGEGWALVDWDTVALAPPERDLWMLVADSRDEAAGLYTRLTGTPLDDAALDFFRVTWDLKDLAEYLNVLRSSHQENEDTVRQCRALGESAALRRKWLP